AWANVRSRHIAGVRRPHRACAPIRRVPRVFRFRSVQSVLAPQGPGGHAFSGPTPGPSAMNTERILLVDDSENDNLFHEITIRKTGFAGEIRAFESAEDFLQFLRQDEGGVPTLVLLDINLPGMS